jgi:hypothetical protein
VSYRERAIVVSIAYFLSIVNASRSSMLVNLYTIVIIALVLGILYRVIKALVARVVPRDYRLLIN